MTPANDISALARLMGPVARRLLGEPNKHLSGRTELRWGSKGSLAIDLQKGTWFDHEAKDQGGGVLDLIERERRCGRADALAWLESEGLLEQRQDDRRRSVNRESIFYDYRDAGGAVAYRVERRGKNCFPPFLQHGPDGRGGFHVAKGCMSGVQRLPYRLPELLAADANDIIFIVEGEKDADRLTGLGLVATTNSEGAGKFRAELAPHFAGRRIVIIPDNDRPGRDHAADIAGKLSGAAAELGILELPGGEKSDVSDWLANGGSALDLKRMAEEALASSGPDLLPMIDAGDFEGLPVPDREWAVEGWEPLGTCVLLTGMGATGKSLLTQQRMTCSALGIPFMGVSVRQGPSIYITCEDDKNEIHRRQHAINQALGITWADLRGKLKLVSLKGQLNKELCTFDIENRLHVTDRWRSLVATIQRIRATHVALDNVAHFFTGNENIRNQVAAFAGLLDGLAGEIGGVVILLGHPNKAGDEFSGSTAWENQVRARLYLGLDKEADGTVNDPDARVLTNSKPNYSRRGEQLRFVWHRWAFMRLEDMAPNVTAEIARVAADNAHLTRFLDCLRERTRQRRAVSEKRGPTFAPSVFATMAEAKGSRKADLDKAMDALFRTGKIERAELWKGDDRKPVFGLRETAGNGAANTVRGTQETPQEPAEMRAGDAGNTHTIYKYIPGAASGAAAPFDQEEGARDLSRVVFPAEPAAPSADLSWMDEEDPAADLERG
jgi:RecA-family ATPase